MSWILSTLICLGYLFMLIELQILQLDMSWISINIDRTLFYSHEYVLDVYFHEYNSKFYQLDMSWILSMLICLGYLSMLICLGYLSMLIELQILST
jgi:hypothetical protein